MERLLSYTNTNTYSYTTLRYNTNTNSYTDSNSRGLVMERLLPFLAFDLGAVEELRGALHDAVAKANGRVMMDEERFCSLLRGRLDRALLLSSPLILREVASHFSHFSRHHRDRDRGEVVNVRAFLASFALFLRGTLPPRRLLFSRTPLEHSQLLIIPTSAPFQSHSNVR